MNIEKYTERARGFIQSAQSLAVRDGHQQFSPLHVLKVLLDDSEGLAGGLIDRAGGNSRAILKATEDALKKLPKVSGGGAGHQNSHASGARARGRATACGWLRSIRCCSDWHRAVTSKPTRSKYISMKRSTSRRCVWS